MTALVLIGSALFRLALPVVCLWAAAFCVIAGPGGISPAAAMALAMLPALMPVVSGFAAGALLDASLKPKIRISVFEQILTAAAFYAALQSGAVLDLILKIAGGGGRFQGAALPLNLAASIGRGVFAGGLAAALILLFVLAIEAPLRWFSRLSPAAAGFRLTNIRPIIYFIIIVVLLNELINLFAAAIDPKTVLGILSHV